MANDHLKAAREALSAVASASASSSIAGDPGESRGVQALAKAVEEIIKHLEAQSGGGSEEGDKQSEDAALEDDVDVTGEPRQYD